ncbi:hypothetical protein MX652_15875 [Thauera aromatica]|nr:hypothetical protein [Thauera aromatica]MCK2128160.1 hypothetical protein [Thauera aromatica]
MEIIMLCEQVHRLLIVIGAITTSAEWESFLEIRGSECWPARRIKTTGQPENDVRTIVHTFLDLIQDREPEPDFFRGTSISDPLLSKIKEAATQTQATIGGKVLGTSIGICVGNKELKIAGKIKKTPKQPEDLKDHRFEVLAYIDAPSTWNRTVQVRSKEGADKMTLNIDTRKFLDILHVAQSTQQPCKVLVLETVDAKFNKVKTVEHIDLVDDVLDLRN